MLVRVCVCGPEREDHDRSEDRLGDAGEVGGAVAGVDAAEPAGQYAFFRQGEDVAVDRVVEGEEGGDDAGDDEDVHEVGGPAAHVPGDRGEEEPGGILARRPDDLVVAEGLDGHPDDERVEQAEESDGQVGGARHRALGLAGLAAVDDGRLEAGERGEREREDRGRARDEHVRRGQRGGGQAVRAALDQDSAREQDEYPGLGDEQDTEQLGAEVDRAEAAVADEEQSGQGDGQPGGVGADEGVQGVPGGGGEQAVDPDLHAVVADQRQ